MNHFSNYNSRGSSTNNRFVLLTVALLFWMASPVRLQAQVDQASGWQLILTDDFKAAATVFQNTLLQEPTNENALCGLIFIAETTQDYASYKKHIKKLIESGN